MATFQPLPHVRTVRLGTYRAPRQWSRTAWAAFAVWALAAMIMATSGAAYTVAFETRAAKVCAWAKDSEAYAPCHDAYYAGGRPAAERYRRNLFTD